MVDGLDGRGVYSARFAGPAARDADNNRLLLERLAGLPAASRTARFACRMALADPAGQLRAEDAGFCRGAFTAPRGSAASATTRSSRSPNTTNRSPNWARWPRPC